MSFLLRPWYGLLLSLAFFRDLVVSSLQVAKAVLSPAAVIGYFKSVLLGGDGGVNGGANLHPRLFVDWFEAAMARDPARLELLGEKVRLLGQIYQQADEFMAVVRGLKCALSIAGLCDDRMAEPIQPCDDAARAQIAAIVEQLALADVEATTLSPSR